MALGVNKKVLKIPKLRLTSIGEIENAGDSAYSQFPAEGLIL